MSAVIVLFLNLLESGTCDPGSTTVVEDNTSVANVAEVDDVQGRVWVVEADLRLKHAVTISDRKLRLTSCSHSVLAQAQTCRTNLQSRRSAAPCCHMAGYLLAGTSRDGRRSRCSCRRLGRRGRGRGTLHGGRQRLVYIYHLWGEGNK